jgi:GNAT superfamily N-acetyltransferase
MRQAFAGYAGALPVESGALAESIEDVRQAMRDGGAVLAFLSDMAVGSARFTPEADALYVNRVAVLPAHWHKGVASAMMSYIEEIARGLQKAAIRIQARNSLPSNVGLYRALGYETVSIDPHPRGPDQVWSMRKLLSGQ